MVEPEPMEPVEVVAERTLVDKGITASTKIISGVSPHRKKGPPKSWDTTGLDTELWIIERSDGSAAVEEPYEAPLLKAKLPEQEEEIPLPLKHTDVRARIDVFIATVEVTQQYHNPYQTKIEAVYVFP